MSGRVRAAHPRCESMLTPSKITVSDLIGSCGHRPAILPRSRDLPFASTEGRRSRNFNKTGVRLWTEFALVTASVEVSFGRGVSSCQRVRWWWL